MMAREKGSKGGITKGGQGRQQGIIGKEDNKKTALRRYTDTKQEGKTGRGKKRRKKVKMREEVKRRR